MLSIALKKCVDEKLSGDSDFKLTDFGDKVVDEILEKLKGMRTMNNKEIEYLRALLGGWIYVYEYESALPQHPGLISLVFWQCRDSTPKRRRHASAD